MPWSRKSVESEILSEHIKKEREAAKKGKQPYYLKKCEFSFPIISLSFSLVSMRISIAEIQHAVDSVYLKI